MIEIWLYDINVLDVCLVPICVFQKVGSEMQMWVVKVQGPLIVYGKGLLSTTSSICQGGCHLGIVAWCLNRTQTLATMPVLLLQLLLNEINELKKSSLIIPSSCRSFSLTGMFTRLITNFPLVWETYLSRGMNLHETNGLAAKLFVYPCLCPQAVNKILAQVSQLLCPTTCQAWLIYKKASKCSGKISSEAWLYSDIIVPSPHGPTH